MRGWTVRDSAELYGISNWGKPYFSVGDKGRVRVHPRGPKGHQVDLLGHHSNCNFCNFNCNRHPSMSEDQLA